MSRVLRFRCDSCHRVAGVLDREDGGLWLRFGRRTKMRGRSPEEAVRWEYGTADRPPRAGEPPPGALIVDQRWEHEVWDPRRSDEPPPIPTSWRIGEPYRSPPWDFEMWSLHAASCSRCGARLQWPERAVISEALTTADRTGQAVSLTMHPRADGRR